MSSHPYAKASNAKATIGESQALARGAAYPAIIGTRFALILSVLSVFLSAAALAVALAR